MGIDMLKDLVPYVAPALIAFFGVTIGPAFITTRRVRQDLAADTELLARLQAGSKEHTELAEAVRSRTLHLVSMIHYPAATRLDVLAWLGAFGCAVLATAWLVILTQPALRQFTALDPLTASFPVGIGPISVMSAWVGFQQPWSKRAVSRVRYVRAQLGEDEAQETWRSLRLAEKASFVVGILLVLYTLIVVILASLSLPDTAPLFVAVSALLAAAITIAGFILTRSRHALDNVLPGLLQDDRAVDMRREEEAKPVRDCGPPTNRRRVAAGHLRHLFGWRGSSVLLILIGVFGRRRGQERRSPGSSSKSKEGQRWQSQGGWSRGVAEVSVRTKSGSALSHPTSGPGPTGRAADRRGGVMRSRRP